MKNTQKKDFLNVINPKNSKDNLDKLFFIQAKTPKNLFSKNLFYVLRQFDVKRSRLALHLGKSGTTVTNWIKGDTYPDAEDLIKLIHYFGISADAFLFLDLENGNHITDQHVSGFKTNGKGNFKSIDKSNTGFTGFDKNQNTLTIPANGPDLTKEWLLIKLIKENGEKLDKLLNLAKKKNEKGY